MHKDYFLLSDLAAQTSDGKLVNICTEFQSGTSFFNLAPWKEATHIDKDEGVFLKESEKLAGASPMGLGDGYILTKSAYYKRIASLGRYGKAINWDESTINAVPNKGVYMEREIKNLVRNFGNTVEYALLNISQDSDPRYAEGLLPRYSLITDGYGEILDTSGAKTGVKTPFVCLDALGAKNDATRDGKLSSVMVVHFSDIDGVSLLYPRGSESIGFRYLIDSDYHWETNTDGTQRRALTASIDVTCGITVNNSLACTRIANVDPEDETSLKTMMNHLFTAYDRMENYMKDNVMIFTTQEVVSAVRKLQYNNIYHTTLAGIQALNLKGDVVVDRDVFTVCHNMLHTEGRILGAN